MIRKVTGIYFSPTGSTAKVVRQVVEELAGRLKVPRQLYSYTKVEERERHFTFDENDLVVWGSPVYAGRLPNLMLDYVRSAIRGSGCLAVPIVTYGNRSCGNALSELNEIMQKGGCRPMAAAAVVCRHPFSSKLAAGRPDRADIGDITDFSGRIAQKVIAGTPQIVQVPGDPHPEDYYIPQTEDGRPANFLHARPVFDPDRCSGCGLCVRLCPMGSIHYDGGPACRGICIKCHACVTGCRDQAVSFDDPDFLSHVRMLEQNYADRKESEFWL